MYNILTLNKIAAIGTSRLGDNYKYGDDVQNPDAVLVRSAAMHDMEFADNLLAIARAGAGTNNIPKDNSSILFKTEAPVVVKPEIVSKKASVQDGIEPLIQNGIAPIKENSTQMKVTINEPSRFPALVGAFFPKTISNKASNKEINPL